VTESTPHLAYGRHVLLDLGGIAKELLADPAAIEAMLREAACRAGATPIGGRFHHFGAGAGVTGVVLLQESHVSIHTWPEHGFAALDIFMCGATQPETAADYISAWFAPASRTLRIIERGEGR
jgi:S-adenosylmethionine decarboxylase